MASKAIEPKAVVFGPVETKAIFVKKWLNKLNTHLSTFPGDGLPWSEAALPYWCSAGFDFIMPFFRSAKGMGLKEDDCHTSHGALSTEYETVRVGKYPWYGIFSNPFTAAGAIETVVEARLTIWSGKPGRRGHTGEQHCARINELIDKVTEGEVEGVRNSKQTREGQIFQNAAPGELAAAVKSVMRPEQECRIDAAASMVDKARIMGEVVTEMLKTGQLDLAINKLQRQHLGD
ncbi:hypothetical protein Slin15195_G039290 [Septoria linicola]|uniref:Uncharacterized protein n=1 Tax=Septoria linicola TaxID=215465 RepID=A0A9Q9EH33_9PEZI|nr:hypothetical protein Slin14017_G120710 [Septoria linicola]USW50610.1 hypothetical protein Slin15195_G039290 [Septoria linicola]